MLKNDQPQNKSLSQFKPASGDFEFREYPFYWIMRLGNRYTHLMEEQLKKKGMTITSWRVGLILRENGTLSMSEIAKHSVVRLPTITKTVYRMQEQELVQVVQNQQDGRVSMVTITELGIEAINQVIENTSRTIDLAFDGLTISETGMLNQSLRHIFNNLS